MFAWTVFWFPGHGSIVAWTWFHACLVKVPGCLDELPASLDLVPCLPGEGAW